MSTRVKIYVRPSGDDLTGDGTSARPFKTVQRALRAVPLIDPGDMRFVIDNTGCVEKDPIVFPPFVSGLLPLIEQGTDFASFFFEGYVTLQAMPTELDVLNDPTTTFTYDPVSGLATVQDTSKAWVPDQFKGKWLVGSHIATAVLELAAISGNTANTLDTSAWAPQFTPPVRIVDLSAELNGSVILSGVGAPISFNGQRMIRPGTFKEAIYANGCEDFYALLCDLKDPHISSRFAVLFGCYMHGEGGGNVTDMAFEIDEGLVAGYLADCSPTTIGNMTISGILENCNTSGFAHSPSMAFADCEVRGRPLVLGAGAALVLALKADNMPGDAIVANGPGVLELYAVGTGPAVGGIGLHASNGAQVHVHGNVNPTGAGGDLKVGQNPVRTWADFRTNPPVKNEIDQTPGTGDGSRVWE